MAKSARCSPEVRERAVRMVFEHERKHTSQWPAIVSIAGKIWCTPETRCTVERLMRRMGRAGAVRGERIRTTIPEELLARPADLGERDCAARRPQPAVGGRSDLYGYLVGVRVRGVRDRCVLPSDRRVACLPNRQAGVAVAAE